MVSGRISSRARSYVRRHATAVMQTQVRIERVEKAQFDNDNLELSANAGNRVVVYEGMARLWAASGQGVVQIADDNVVLQSTFLSIPWNEPQGDLQVQRDDEFVVIGSHVDDYVIGKRGVILDVEKAGDLRATRRFSVQIHQSKGQHG